MLKFIWDDLVWVLPVFLTVLCYLTGDLVQMLFQVHKGIAVKVLSGFVILLCLFHLTSLPFMYNDWPFTTLYSLWLCEVISVIIAYVIVSLAKRRAPLQDDLEGLQKACAFHAKKQWWHFLLWAAILVLIVFHVSMVIRFVRFNVDDNFYVSESLTILSRNRLMNVLPSSGIEGSVFPATYLLVSWEVLIAALSKLFLVSPAVFCHSIFPALLIPLHYAAYYIAVREFSRKHAGVSMLFVIFLNFACGPSTYNQGAFLTLRIWQGKSVLVNIILPLLLYLFLRIAKTKKLPLRNIFFLFAVLLAGQAVSTVGTYLVPVLYGVYTVTCLIITHKWKTFFKLWIPAAGITPFVLWKVWLLLRAGTLSDLSEGSGVFDRSFGELLTRYFGFSLVPVFFLLGIIILAVIMRKKETKPLRFFFLIASLILIVCFINPFMMPFTEHYVTGTGVYWRMFWLLQITPLIAVSLTQLVRIPKMQLSRITLLLLFSVIILISGKSIFKDEDVAKKEFTNHAKVSETTRNIALTVQDEIVKDNPDLSEEERQEIAQHTILLLPRTLSDEMRQYADLCLIHYAYYSNNYYAYMTDEEFGILKALYDTLYRKKTWLSGPLYRTLSMLEIDYVAIGAPTAEANKEQIPFWFDEVFRNSRYVLYKVNRGH